MWNALCRFVRRVKRLEVSIYAAYAAYFWILAIFPAVMLIISVLQYTPITPDDLRELLEKLVPASLHTLTDYMIDELFALESPAVLSISAVTALWMTAKGILSLVRGLNRIYVVRESRSFLGLRLRCVLFALLGVAATVLILGMRLISEELFLTLLTGRPALARALQRLSPLRYTLTVSVLTLLFSVTYAVFPNRQVRFADSLPGGFVSAVLWVLFSQLFSVYVERFGNYSLYYGSLSVIAMALLWLYVVIFLFFCGGMLNRALERRRTARQTPPAAPRRPKPRGTR